MQASGLRLHEGHMPHAAFLNLTKPQMIELKTPELQAHIRHLQLRLTWLSGVARKETIKQIDIAQRMLDVKQT